jgi:hypothetical protein
VVNILENLSKVGRFSMTLMFLTVKDKAGKFVHWISQLLADTAIDAFGVERFLSYQCLGSVWQ